MSKPFQFSIRRMLLAVALFCAASALFSESQHASHIDIRIPCLVFSALIVGGATGVIVGKSLLGVFVGSVAIFLWITLASLGLPFFR
jgi:hypothetical protein